MGMLWVLSAALHGSCSGVDLERKQAAHPSNFCRDGAPDFVVCAPRAKRVEQIDLENNIFSPLLSTPCLHGCQSSVSP